MLLQCASAPGAKLETSGATLRAMASKHISKYLQATAELSLKLDGDRLDALAHALATLRARGGRLFVLGIGGGAGHASHAVNDFRKLCAIESYTPTDNVSE